MSIYQDIIRADAIVAAVHWCYVNRVVVDWSDGLCKVTKREGGFEYRSEPRFDFIDAVDEVRAKCDHTHPRFKGSKPDAPEQG